MPFRRAAVPDLSVRPPNTLRRGSHVRRPTEDTRGGRSFKTLDRYPARLRAHGLAPMMLTLISGHNCTFGSFCRPSISCCVTRATPPGVQISLMIAAEAKVSAGA